MNSQISILSLNVGMSSSLAGLKVLLSNNSVHIVFLQEVSMCTETLNSFLQDINFKAVANVDSDNSSRPGTAILWREGIPVTNVYTLVDCRCQVATLGSYMLLNIYGPSGSNKRRDRAIFFDRQVFDILKEDTQLSWIIGGEVVGVE